MYLGLGLVLVLGLGLGVSNKWDVRNATLRGDAVAWLGLVSPGAVTDGVNVNVTVNRGFTYIAHKRKASALVR